MTDHKHHPLCKEINEDPGKFGYYCFCNVFKVYDQWLSEQPKSTPISIKFPEKRTVYNREDADKRYNEAIEDMKALNQSQSTPTLQELDEIKLYSLIMDYTRLHSDIPCSEYVEGLVKKIRGKFGTKIEPSKEVTEGSVEEMVNITRPFWKAREDNGIIFIKLTEEEATEICQAIHNLITRTPNAKNNEG